MKHKPEFVQTARLHMADASLALNTARQAPIDDAEKYLRNAQESIELALRVMQDAANTEIEEKTLARLREVGL